MPTEEQRTGPTPAGGVRSVIRYLDAKGNPADKEQAVRAEVIEYGPAGEELRRTYAELRRERKGET